MGPLDQLKEEILGGETADGAVAQTIDESMLNALLDGPVISWVQDHKTEAPSELKTAVAALFKAAGFKGGKGALEKAKAAYLSIFPPESAMFDMVLPRSVFNHELNEAGVPDELFGKGESFDQPLLEAQRKAFEKDLPGGLKQSIGTACYLLRTFPDVVGGNLEFNEMTGVVTINRKEIKDEDVTRIRERIEHRFTNRRCDPIQIGKDMMWDAVLLVSKEFRYHPVQDYLSGLAWDGVPRLERVVAEILKAEDTIINRLMFRKFSIACVARAKVPGEKVDHMLVAQGPQGARKSTFFETLASKEFFTDVYIDFDDPKHLMLMRTAWIAEFAEMKSLLNAQSEEAIKAGLTRTEDRYVPPYGRAPITVKRHTVFCGTANPQGLFRDPTGNRRYWPLSTGDNIDIPKLMEWRDQIWAEAVAAYNSGEKWYFKDADQLADLQDVQASYVKSDAWEAAILTWVGNHYISVDVDRQRNANDPNWKGPLETGEFDIGTVMAEALRIPTDRQDPKAAGRVKAILEPAGYKEVRPYTPKGTPRLTFHVRDDLVEEFKKTFSDRQKEEKASRKAANGEENRAAAGSPVPAKSNDVDFSM